MIVDPGGGTTRASLGDLPDIEVVPSTVESAAGTVRATATAFATGTRLMADRWKALPDALSAPGVVEPLFPAMEPVATDAEALGTAASRLATELETFAAGIVPLLSRRADLVTRIGQYTAAQVIADLAGPEATSDADERSLASRSAGLQAEAAALAADWQRLQEDTAAAIAAIRGGAGTDLPAVATAAPTLAEARRALLDTIDWSTALDGLAIAAGAGPEALAAWRAAHADLLAKLRDDPPAALAIAAWWKALDATARAAITAAIPGTIGNLEGVAYTDRDRANRTVLTARIAALQRRIAAGEQAWEDGPITRFGRPPKPEWLIDAAADLTSLLAIRSALDTRGSRIPRQLVSLSSDHPPLAAVSIGDLDTATNVTYLVSGMFSATKDMPGSAAAAQNLLRAQVLATQRTDLAVVDWIGYKSPGFLTEPMMGKAEAGAPLLNAALSGVDAVHAGDPSYSLNVVGHSYGTTTASLALSQRDEHVSSFVMLASAGVSTSIPNAAALHAVTVYTGQAPNAGVGETGDHVAWIGRDTSGRQDPTDPSFGAVNFSAAGVPGATDEQGVTTHSLTLAASDPGTGYLDPNSEALYNTARATTGNGQDLDPYVPDRIALQDEYERRHPAGSSPWMADG